MTIRIERPIAGPDDVLAVERRAPWEEVIPAPSTYELIAAAAADGPQATAITFLATGDPEEEPVHVSYRQLIRRIIRAANLFHALGVGPRDAVSLLLPHLPQTHYAMWGAGAVGIVNPINFLLQPDQIADLMNAAGTRVLVALGPHPQLDVWQKVEAVRRRVPGLQAVLRVGPGDPAGIPCPTRSTGHARRVNLGFPGAPRPGSRASGGRGSSAELGEELQTATDHRRIADDTVMAEAGGRFEGDVRADAGDPLAGLEGNFVVLRVVQPEGRDRVVGE